jgi:DNA-directed RNA polymerase specialized sigma24 family protein
MDTCIPFVEQVQNSVAVRRPARRWPRRGAPLRWGPSGRNRRSPGSPGGAGSGPPVAKQSTISREDAAWLDSLRPWARGIARRVGVNDSDREDVVQEAFTVAAIQWSAFVARADVPARTARRRWLAEVLFRIAYSFRGKANRARTRESRGFEGAENVTGATSHEGPISARELLRALEGATTAERWRVWVAYEIDEVAVPEIARQEGRTVPTIYTLLRLARKSFAAALAREAAIAAGPIVVRNPRSAGKPRA